MAEDVDLGEIVPPNIEDHAKTGETTVLLGTGTKGDNTATEIDPKKTIDNSGPAIFPQHTLS
jgi:hypothetical protein